jgi:hypothetical protein
MNKLEHYIYVNSKSKLTSKSTSVPERYLSIINSDDEIFPDLDIIVENLWNGTNTENIIDCRRVAYLNKCNLVGLKMIKFDDYMVLMMPLRKIGDDPTPVELLKITYDSSSAMYGGNSDKLIYYINYFKHLYLKTNDDEYKKYYKSFKKALTN